MPSDHTNSWKNTVDTLTDAIGEHLQWRIDETETAGKAAVMPLIRTLVVKTLQRFGIDESQFVDSLRNETLQRGLDTLIVFLQVKNLSHIKNAAEAINCFNKAIDALIPDIESDSLRAQFRTWLLSELMLDTPDVALAWTYASLLTKSHDQLATREYIAHILRDHGQGDLDIDASIERLYQYGIALSFGETPRVIAPMVDTAGEEVSYNPDELSAILLTDSDLLRISNKGTHRITKHDVNHFYEKLPAWKRSQSVKTSYRALVRKRFMPTRGSGRGLSLTEYLDWKIAQLLAIRRSVTAHPITEPPDAARDLNDAL